MRYNERMADKHWHLQHYFFLALLLLNIVVVYTIFRPFISFLIVGITFAVIFHPLYRWLRRTVARNDSLAAALTTLIILVIVFTPLTWFGFQIFGEAQDVYQRLNDGERDLTQVITDIGQARLQHFLPQASIDVAGYVRQVVEWLLQHVGSAFTSVAQFVLYLLLSLLVLYYSLKDGYRLLNAVVHLSPLADRYDTKIVARLHAAITSVIRGSLVVALIQGVCAGIGFALFAVPNPALWGSLAVVAALVPTLGTGLIIIPGVLYLLATNHLIASVGLVLWGVMVVGLIDNLLRPKLMERDLGIHPLLILLAVIGGIHLFGPVGFLLGPLVLSFLFALLDLYPLLLQPRE